MSLQIMRVIPLIMSVSVGLACFAPADQPAAPTAAATSVTTAAVQPSVTSTDAVPADAAKTPEQLRREAAEEQIRKHGLNGYKPEKKSNGETVYCIREIAMGSKFETKRCRSFEQLRDEATNAKDYTEQMQHFGWQKPQ
jgi:hypothetical protein